MTDKSSLQKTQKRYSSKSIPEEVQFGIRARLKFSRVIRGIKTDDMKNKNVISPWTIGQYENRDLSSVKLVTLYQLSEYYKIPFSEFINYIIGHDDSSMFELNRLEREVAVCMREMSEQNLKLFMSIANTFAKANESSLG